METYQRHEFPAAMMAEWIDPDPPIGELLRAQPTEPAPNVESFNGVSFAASRQRRLTDEERDDTWET